MTENKNIKLVKCTGCGKAFYIKTTTKGKIRLRCPYCEKDVEIIINGENKNGPSQSSES